MAERKPRNWPSISGSQEERATAAFRRLEDMTRLISDWVWETDSDGRITYVSERIIDRLGLHPVQVVGKLFTEFGAFTSSDGTSAALPNLKRPFRDVSFEAEGHDGALRHFAVSGLPRFSDQEEDFVGATGIAKDVTDLVRVERANVQLADAIEVLSGYFALYDEEDKLVISNARFRQMNKNLSDVIKPGSDFEALLRAEVADGRYPEAEEDPDGWIKRRLARRDQTSGPFEVETEGQRWLYVDEEHLPHGGIVMMSRDITEMKRAMDALRDSATKHREFAANVAHKLRTPLAVLRSNLDNLNASDEVVALRLEVDTLARMVEQLLTLTRYENFVIPRTGVSDLYDVTINVVSSLAPIAIKEGRSLELEGFSGPINVHGDSGALEHAIRNLIENAIKYSARGSSVVVNLDTDPPSIRVSDQGRGIASEDRVHLFEKFVRSDRRGSGAGLGLNIVKTIVDLHDAEISVGHSESGGAEFIVVFPAFDERRVRSMKI